MLRDRWPQLSLIAVDTSRDERVEIAVRMAGASVYLPFNETQQLEEALGSFMGAERSSDDTSSTEARERGPPSTARD